MFHHERVHPCPDQVCDEKPGDPQSCAVHPSARNEQGPGPVAVAGGVLRLRQFCPTETCRALSMRGAAVWGRPLVGRIGGVDSVHTLGHGLGRIGDVLARTRHVSGEVQCLQGLEPGSSPTSGTMFPQFSGGFVCFFVCTLCTLSPLI